MPIALYYKALIREYQPDLKSLLNSEILEFYSSYPKQEVFPDWAKLYRDYPQSPESLEARWRIAISYARRGYFETAVSLCKEAIENAEKLREVIVEASGKSGLFSSPPETTINERRLDEIKYRAQYLMELIENNDVVEDSEYRERLAMFIGLDREGLDYRRHLASLLSLSKASAPLQDNIELALITQIESTTERASALNDFIDSNKANDSLLEAYYELAICYVHIWRNSANGSQERIDNLAKARETLKQIIEDFPKNPFSVQALNIRNGLPRAE